MRNPTIHIRLTDLALVLTQLGLEQPDKLAAQILTKVKPYQITDRYLKLLELQDKVKGRVKRSMKADVEAPQAAIERFNFVLTTIRTDNVFAKVKTIRKDSPHYLQLKEVAGMAHQFVLHYDIRPVEEGYKEFINIGLKLMKKFALNKFKYHEQNIYNYMDNQLLVLADPTPEATQEIHNAWATCMAEYGGVLGAFVAKDDYSRRVHLVYAKQQADEEQADYHAWVAAQFDALAFLNAVPNLPQLYGETARERFERWLNKPAQEETNLPDLYKNQEDA